jgi:glycosyltransferase involved in cell wall biosynthesis
MKRGMKKLGFKKSVLFIFAYNADSIVGRMDEDISVYFCNDAFDKLYNRESLRQKVAALERRLIKKTDAVITVSEKLTEERSPFAKKIATIHHGVDYQLFEDVLVSGIVPDYIKKIPSPVIGYSGVVRHIIDLDILQYVASQRPGWSVVIVGPVTESDKKYYEKVDELKKMGNVHFLGPKPSDEIPRYINQFDVCVLPYTLQEVSTYYAAPLKFYEYLAAGKPVVSTVGPKGPDDVIVINAVTKETFLSGVEKALTMTSAEMIKKRKEVARLNSWSERVNSIADFLSRLN